MSFIPLEWTSSVHVPWPRTLRLYDFLQLLSHPSFVYRVDSDVGMTIHKFWDLSLEVTMIGVLYTLSQSHILTVACCEEHVGSIEQHNHIKTKVKPNKVITPRKHESRQVTRRKKTHHNKTWNKRKPIKGRSMRKLNNTNRKLEVTTSNKWINNRDLVRKSNRNTGINTRRLKRPK